jgi:CelD/BcsL family acetyltransferase involved in cellulose biosynthesis
VTGGLAASVLAEADHAAWDRLVAESPEGSPYSTSTYLAALCRATGGRFRVLAVAHAGEMLGGAALYEERLPIGTRVSSRALLYYNGLVMRPHATQYPSQRDARRTEVLGALERFLSRAPYVAVLLKNRSPFADARAFLARGWSVVPSYTYVAPLTDLPQLWKRVEQNLRRLVGRCERAQLRVSEDGDFESFFRLHRLALERRGLAPYLSAPSFERFFETLRASGLARLYHARLPDGRSVSAQLVLAGAHPVSHTIAAAADADHFKLGATAFLRWRVFEDLARRGSTANDLTDAALGPVTHFKSQLGGDLETCLVVSRESRLYRAWRRITRRGPGACVARLLERGAAPA